MKTMKNQGLIFVLFLTVMMLTFNLFVCAAEKDVFFSSNVSAISPADVL